MFDDNAAKAVVALVLAGLVGVAWALWINIHERGVQNRADAACAEACVPLVAKRIEDARGMGCYCASEFGWDLSYIEGEEE